MALAQRCSLFGSSLCSLFSASGGQASPRSPATADAVWISRVTNNNNNNTDAKIIRSLEAVLLPPLRPLHCLGVSAASRGLVSAQAQASNDTTEKLPATADFKHVLLPIIDRNPYLSGSTRQAAATTTALAKKYGADITVVVIDQGSQEARDDQEAKDKHELQLKTIRWHLSQGGFEEYTLVERTGQEQKPAAVIGELADDLGLDLVIMDMEAIHQKHIDANLLVEFVPCPVLMLPL